MKLLREPLVHFLALGGLLFGVFALASQRPKGRDATLRIVITPFELERLGFKAPPGSGLAPDAARRAALIEAFVREEILVREARRLGLDREDPIIRRQLRERMELLAAEKASAVVPSDRELEDFLRAQATTFRGTDGRTPPLAEIRDAVRSAWQRAQRQAAIDAAYSALRAKYEVVDETSPKAPGK
jgi:hypothetical protein